MFTKVLFINNTFAYKMLFVKSTFAIKCSPEKALLKIGRH